MVSEEALELERISVTNPDKAACTTREACDYRGEYVRCYLDSCVQCPHYSNGEEERSM